MHNYCGIGDDHEGNTYKEMGEHDNNRGSPMKLVKLYSHMTPGQRQLVNDAGFGGLLTCTCSQLQPDLCRWLLECFDPDTCELVFPGRGRIPITEATVERVMGIPRGNRDVKYETDGSANSFMLDQLEVTYGKQPKVSDVGKMLQFNKIADDKYLRIWTVFAACSVITPTFSTKVSPRCYRAVIDVSEISQQNWCKLVIQILKECAQPESKKPIFKPCLLFLMILYIDSLQIGFSTSQGSRVSVWTNKLVKNVIAMDTNDDGSFGALPLKEIDVQDTSLFGSTLQIDSFITANVPEQLGKQEQLKAKRAVQNLCNGFSDLVSKFLREIYEPDNEGGGANSSHVNRKRGSTRRTCMRQMRSRNESRDPELGSKDDLDSSDAVCEQQEIQQDSSSQEEEDEDEEDNDNQCADGNEDEADEIEGAHVLDEKGADLVKEGPGSHDDEGADGTQHPEDEGSQAGPPSGREDTGAQLVLGEISDSSQHAGDARLVSEVTNSIQAMDLHTTFVVKEMCTEVEMTQNVVTEFVYTTPKLPQKPKRKAGNNTLTAEEGKNSKMARMQGGKETEVTPGVANQSAERDGSKDKQDVAVAISGEQEAAKSNYAEKTDCIKSGNNIIANPSAEKLGQIFRGQLLTFECGGFGEREENNPTEALQDDISITTLVSQSHHRGGVGNNLSEVAKSYDELVVLEKQRNHKLEEEDCAQVNDDKEAQEAAEPENVLAVSNCKITPVPHIHHQRVVRAGGHTKSPFVDYTKRQQYYVPKYVQDLYNEFITHWPISESKEAIIVDYGRSYITLGDLADSIRPTGCLSTRTADCIIYIQAIQHKEGSKMILPYRIATFAMAEDLGRREMCRHFKFSNHLDHYNLIMFPVIETSEARPKDPGHWFLLVLNLEAQRFEVIDSVRGEHDKALLETCRKIIGSIKTLWQMNYRESPVDISNYELLHIHAPQQETIFDCGFFMLKYIDTWNGKTMPVFDQSDMPNIRMDYLYTMLHSSHNLADWKQILRGS